MGTVSGCFCYLGERNKNYPAAEALHHTHILIPSAQTEFGRPQVTQTYGRISALKINTPHVSSPVQHRLNTETEN